MANKSLTPTRNGEALLLAAHARLLGNMRRALFFFLCVASTVGCTAEPSLPKFFANEGVYDLSAFQQPIGNQHYYGSYTFTYALTGGTALHLFPNRRFVIVEFTDIGPDEVTGRGTYKVEGPSLKLDFSYVKAKHEILRKEFADLHIVWGWMDKGDYVTGFDVFIFPSEAWRKLLARDSGVEYMLRRDAYHDWQRILKDYDASPPR